MVKVLVSSPFLVTRIALAELINALGFTGVIEPEESVELAVWDLGGETSAFPLPPPVPTLALVDEEDAMIDLLRLGYRGFIRAHEGPETLKKALAAIRRGEIWAERALLTQALTPREAPRLTTQEQRVLNLLSQGLSNRAIAGELGVGEKTVKAYLSKLFDKLGARNRTDLILQHMRYRARKD